MNDPQYQTGSSWALGGALRALGGALGSRYRRQKSAKNVPKIPKKRRCRRALYAKFPWPAGLRGSRGVCARVRARGRHHSAESREPSRSTRAARARAEADRNGPGKRHVRTCAVQPRARLYTSHAARTRPPQSRPSHAAPEAGARRQEGASGCHWPRPTTIRRSRSPLPADL